MSGKLSGSTYKVFVSPSGVKYYSLSKAENEGGFKKTESFVDGRTTRRKTQKPDLKK